MATEGNGRVFAVHGAVHQSGGAVAKYLKTHGRARFVQKVATGLLVLYGAAMRAPLALALVVQTVVGLGGIAWAAADDGPNPRHVQASTWPVGTMLYVDFQWGTFTRSPVPNQGYHLSHIVRVRKGVLSVYIPGEVFGRYEEVHMDELKLIRESGVFRLMGRTGGKYYWFEGTAPREIPRARWAGTPYPVRSPAKPMPPKSDKSAGKTPKKGSGNSKQWQAIHFSH